MLIPKGPAYDRPDQGGVPRTVHQTPLDVVEASGLGGSEGSIFWIPRPLNPKNPKP